MSINPHDLQRMAAAFLLLKHMMEAFDEEMLNSWKAELKETYGDPVQRFLDKKEAEKTKPAKEKKLRVGGCQIFYLSDRRAARIKP